MKVHIEIWWLVSYDREGGVCWSNLPCLEIPPHCLSIINTSKPIIFHTQYTCNWLSYDYLTRHQWPTRELLITLHDICGCQNHKDNWKHMFRLLWHSAKIRTDLHMSVNVFQWTKRCNLENICQVWRVFLYHFTWVCDLTGGPIRRPTLHWV